MKTFAVCVFALFIVLTVADRKPLTDKEREKLKTIHNNCQSNEATRVDEDLIKKLSKGEFTNDQKLKVHLLCMAKGGNLVKDNGDLNTDLIKTKWTEHYDAADVTKLEASCLVQSTTPEETAFNLLKCQHDIVGSADHQHHHH